MSLKEKFKQGREWVVPQIMEYEEDDAKKPKPSKFSPVRVKIGGRYFTTKEGVSVFENRQRAQRAIIGALKKATAGLVENSEGQFEKVRGADGVIKILFKDVYISPEDFKSLKSQFVTYFVSSITFEPSTLEEFLLNHFRVFV